MKRTTLVLEDGCIEGVRQLARRERRQLSAVVNELLAEGLQRRRIRERAQLVLPTFAMGKPPVHLGKRDALESLMHSCCASTG